MDASWDSSAVGGRRATQEMHGDALFPGELLDEICWVGWVGRVGKGRLGNLNLKKKQFESKPLVKFFCWNRSYIKLKMYHEE